MDRARLTAVYWPALFFSTVAGLFVAQTNDFILVKTLHASPLDVGVANALETAGHLFLSIPIGYFIGRFTLSTVQSAASAADALLILSLLLLLQASSLTVQWVWAISAAAGISATFHQISSSSAVPRLFEDSDLPGVNGRRNSLTQSCGVLIPAFAGILIQETGPSPLLAAGVLCSVVASVLMLRVSAFESVLPEEETTRSRQKKILSRPLLSVCLLLFINNFGLAFVSSVETIYLNRELDFDFGFIGVVLSAGSLGGVLGALSSGWAYRRIGFAGVRAIAPVILLACMAALWAAYLVPGWAAAIVLTQTVVYGFTMSVFNVSLFSWVGSFFRKSLLSKTYGILGTVGMGSVPAGALVGGWMGATVGTHTTVLLWCALGAVQIVAAILTRRSFSHSSQSGR